MGCSLEELNEIYLLDFIKLTKIHFGITTENQVNKPRKATQKDIDIMMGRR